MAEPKILIVGAGPAGLAAAHELARQGVKPVVFEKSGHIGGISRTEIYKGFHFDIGGHRFFTKIDSIEHLWKEMLGDKLQKVSRLSRIYYRECFFNYPLTVGNALGNLGALESSLIILSWVRAQLRPCPEEKTFEQWVSNRFGRRLFNTFFKTYTEKVWGIPCHEIRSDWSSQRIKGLSLIAALTSALLKNNRPAKTLIEAFDYPLRGPGMMWEHFRENIESLGGKVHLHSEVVDLRHERGIITGVTVRQREGIREIRPDHVISSLPIPRLVRQMTPSVPEQVLDAAAGLSYRSFIIVGLVLHKRHLFPDQWIYVHSPDVKVGRIQNFKNWSAAMVPDQGKTSVGMEYFCHRGDDLWNMKDEKLVELASNELQALGLAESRDVIDAYIIRQPNAYPVYDRRYAHHLAVIREHIEEIGNLQTVGRNGMHRYNNMDHSMATGIMAARNIRGGTYDLWSDVEDHQYLEEDGKSFNPLREPEEMLIRAFSRIDKLALASAVGTVSGLLLFLATIWLVIKSGRVVGANLQLLSQYFIGYTVTVKGAFIAFGYTFMWGFLFGWLFAYLRNFFLAVYIFWIRKKTEMLSVKDFFDHL